MQPGHAVDAVRADDRQRRHLHAPLAQFLDERDASHQLFFARKMRAHVLQEARIDLVDDLQMTRQPVLEHAHRPGFECLGQQRVVGVAHRPLTLDHRRVPVHAVLVDEQAQQFRHRQCRMRVVQVDRDFLAKVVESVMLGKMPVHDVLQRCADEEELLLEPQLAARLRGVVRIQHPVDDLGGLLARARRMEVAAGEGSEVDRLRGRGLPQAQHGHATRVMTGHDEVDGVRVQAFAGQPAATRAVGDHAARQTDWIADLRPLELPGVAMPQPVVGRLDLAAVMDALREHAVAISQPVAERRQTERGEGVEKARCQAPETAIAQRSVRLALDDVFHRLAGPFGRLAQRLRQLERGHRVGQRAPHQELHRQVVHALGAAILVQRLVHALRQLCPARVCGDPHPRVGRSERRILSAFTLDALDQGVGRGPRRGPICCLCGH